MTGDIQYWTINKTFWHEIKTYPTLKSWKKMQYSYCMSEASCASLVTLSMTSELSIDVRICTNNQPPEVHCLQLQLVTRNSFFHQINCNKLAVTKQDNVFWNSHKVIIKVSKEYYRTILELFTSADKDSLYKSNDLETSHLLLDQLMSFTFFHNFLSIIVFDQLCSGNKVLQLSIFPFPFEIMATFLSPTTTDSQKRQYWKTQFKLFSWHLFVWPDNYLNLLKLLKFSSFKRETIHRSEKMREFSPQYNNYLLPSLGYLFMSKKFLSMQMDIRLLQTKVRHTNTCKLYQIPVITCLNFTDFAATDVLRIRQKVNLLWLALNSFKQDKRDVVMVSYPRLNVIT